MKYTIEYCEYELFRLVGWKIFRGARFDSKKAAITRLNELRRALPRQRFRISELDTDD